MAEFDNRHNLISSSPEPIIRQTSSILANQADNVPGEPSIIRRPARSVTLDTINTDRSPRATPTGNAGSGAQRTASHVVNDPSDSGFNRRPSAALSRRSTRSAHRLKPTEVVRKMTTGLFTPEKKIRTAPNIKNSVMNLIKSSWVNVLLICIPISWALHFTIEEKNPTVVFVLCFLAIIPLAGLLGYTTECVTMYTSQTIGGLLNATLGNAVELIVSIIALIKCELQVVQSSLIGSILSNLLLVCGMSFFLGGTRWAEQQFQATSAQLNSSLLLMSVISVLIPSAFHFSINTTADGAGTSITSGEEKIDILAMSHGVAIILLLLYVGYLAFQLFTHADLYADEEGPTRSTKYPEGVANYPSQLREKIHFPRKTKHGEDSTSVSNEDEYLRQLATANHPVLVDGGVRHALAHIHGNSSAIEARPGMRVDNEGRVLSWGPGGVPAGAEHMDLEKGEDDEEEQPEMSWFTALAAMVVITVLVGVTAEFLVGSINGLVEQNPSLSQEWVGLILLPIVGNAAEHWTAVLGAYKDKLDLSISVAVGSSIQIALFVIPFSVVLGWIINKPLLMLFDPFESVVLFLSVIIVNQALADGKTNWMEGLILFMVYILIAVAFWYYPGSNTANLIGQSGCS